MALGLCFKETRKTKWLRVEVDVRKEGGAEIPQNVGCSGKFNKEGDVGQGVG